MPRFSRIKLNEASGWVDLSDAIGWVGVAFAGAALNFMWPRVRQQVLWHLLSALLSRTLRLLLGRAHRYTLQWVEDCRAYDHWRCMLYCSDMICSDMIADHTSDAMCCTTGAAPPCTEQRFLFGRNYTVEFGVQCSAINCYCVCSATYSTVASWDGKSDKDINGIWATLAHIVSIKNYSHQLELTVKCFMGTLV